MVTWQRYQQTDQPTWDAFVDASRTPMFFFRRGYMDYHSSRFTDWSLLCRADDELVAVLPANRVGTRLISHGGLTFGGMVLSKRVRAATVIEAVDELLIHAEESGIEAITYKSIPYVFSAGPSQEDLYALYRRGAALAQRDISSVIPLSVTNRLSKGRKAMIARAVKDGIRVERSLDWAGFHALLSDVLAQHGAVPVHSVAELELLSSRFPDQVQLHVAMGGENMLAGTLLFFFETAVHTQYMATGTEGRSAGALDLLIARSIELARTTGKTYFSFGKSTEGDGRVLNTGLIAQKEGFGARAIVLDTYEIRT